MRVLDRSGVVSRLVVLPIFTMALVMFGGCGEGKIGKARMTLPELGITVDVPSGWKIEGNNSGMCSHGNYIGLLMSEPLAGKTFAKAVESMSKEFGAKILSRNELNIDGKTAVCIAMDAPNDMKVLRLYLDCGTSMAYVSYAVSKADFPAYEPALRASLASVQIK